MTMTMTVAMIVGEYSNDDDNDRYDDDDGGEVIKTVFRNGGQIYETYHRSSYGYEARGGIIEQGGRTLVRELSNCLINIVIIMMIILMVVLMILMAK